MRVLSVIQKGWRKFCLESLRKLQNLVLGEWWTPKVRTQNLSSHVVYETNVGRSQSLVLFLERAVLIFL